MESGDVAIWLLIVLIALVIIDILIRLFKKKAEKELQDLTDKRCKDIDELTAKKEQELMAFIKENLLDMDLIVKDVVVKETLLVKLNQEKNLV